MKPEKMRCLVGLSILLAGLSAVPLATASRACAIARPGETILLRGGVYRETLRPAYDGVTIRVMKGERVTIIGANAIEEWHRADSSWWAPLSAGPRKLLRDGHPWRWFTYDFEGKRLVLRTGGDPRLHLFETLVHTRGIHLAGRKHVRAEGDIEVVDTLVGTVPGDR